MIQFKDIGVHDLVYLDNSGSPDRDNDGEIDGWYVVIGISKRTLFFTAAPLGDMDHSVYVDDADIVRKHISAAAIPAAIEALEKLVYLNASKEGAWKQEQTVLRAVRGEGSM